METALVFALIIYFIPSIIAALRGHGSVMAIVAVNLLFGWSVIGWLWSFIWSLTSTNKNGNITIVNNQQWR